MFPNYHVGLQVRKRGLPQRTFSILFLSLFHWDGRNLDEQNDGPNHSEPRAPIAHLRRPQAGQGTASLAFERCGTALAGERQCRAGVHIRSLSRRCLSLRKSHPPRPIHFFNPNRPTKGVNVKHSNPHRVSSGPDEPDEQKEREAPTRQPSLTAAQLARQSVASLPASDGTATGTSSHQ